MCISFSVKHPQTFRKSRVSLPNMFGTILNMYTYLFNLRLVMKTQVESHDKKPKHQKNFYTWTVVF